MTLPYCPYLQGKTPRFSVIGYSDRYGFRPKNGHGIEGDCIGTERFVSLSMNDKAILEWIENHIDTEKELTNCPCQAEHLLNIYNEETKMP